MSGLPDQPSLRRRLHARLPLAVITATLALHTILTFHFLPPSVFLADVALVGADFDTHYGQVARFIEAMQRWGHIWSYDPSLLAGRPAGVLFDCDTKAWNLWTYALYVLGVPKQRAFNLFVLAASLALPLVALLTGWLFRFARAQTALLTALSTLVWFFDSQTHYFWWIGMVTWALGSYLALVPLGCFARFVDAATMRWGAATAVSLSLVLLVHPFTFFALVVPMGVLFVRAPPRVRAGASMVAAFAIGANAFWWWPALRFAGHALASPFYSQARITDVVYDFLGFAMNANDTAAFMRTGLRVLILGAGTFGLLRWRDARDRRAAPLIAAVLTMLVVSYLGRYVWLTAQVQPYRFIVPATVWMLLPAVSFATDPQVHAMVRRAAPVAVVLAISAIQLLAQDVLYYFSHLLPAQIGFEMDAPWSPTGGPKHLDLRHPLPTPTDYGTIRWFRGHPMDGRVLVEPPVLGERLAAHVPNIQVLGGIRERNIVHARANFFRRYPGRDAPVEVFARYLEQYAVHYVVLSPVLPVPTAYVPLLRPVASLPDARIFAVKQPSALVASGPGHVHASMNRLSVTDTDPTLPLILRYHYLDTLRCAPACRIAPEDPEAALSFIRVEAPHPADFTITHAY